MQGFRDKLSVDIFSSFTEKDAEKINDTAKRLKVSKSELIRVCVLNELPKLIERETKRRNYRRNDNEN